MPIKAGIPLVAGPLPKRPTNLSVIKACRLLDALHPASRDALAAKSFMAYADKGEMIWMAGAPAEFCSVVGTGFVKMSKSTPNGQDVALQLLGPGQAFGLIASLEGREFPLSATAVTNCWYLKIPTREMLTLYLEYPALKDRIIRSIVPRVRQESDMMAHMCSGRVDERIAATLLILADTYGCKTRERIELDLPLTRQDITEIAGTTTEATIRLLCKWQGDGLVSTARQHVTILRPGELVNILQG